MRICLFEDRRVADLAPAAVARPVFDLTFGLGTVDLGHRRYFAPDAVGYLTRPAVADVARDRRPQSPVNDPMWVRSGPTVLVNVRWVPPARAADDPAPTTRELFAGGPFLAVCDGDVAFAALDADLLAGLSAGTLDDALDDWLTSLPRQEVGGSVLRRVADLIERNGKQIESEFPATSDPDGGGFRPPGLHLVGPATRLFVHPSARIDPLCVADTTGGPVVIGPGAVVAAFSRLEGPCAIGTGAHVLGAAVGGGTTVGPHARAGGDLELCVLQAFAEKPYPGFLGRCFVGEWATVGAGVNADLRPGTAIVIGDHARISPGVLLPAGAAVGPFGSIVPTGLFAPRDVPAFCRAGPDGLAEDATMDALFATADAAMRRRGTGFTRPQEAAFRAAFAQTAMARKRALAGDDLTRGRKSSDRGHG